MLRVVGFSGLLLLSAQVVSAQSATDPTAFLNTVNQDSDKTLSLKEVNAYAARRFREMDKNGTHTLSEQGEFVRLVDGLFKQADADGDKTLDVAELSSPAGQKLIVLLH